MPEHQALDDLIQPVDLLVLGDDILELLVESKNVSFTLHTGHGSSHLVDIDASL